jgi:phosphatidate phosphatase APP1
MNVKQYVLSRLDQGERDLNVLARQARIQFPSERVVFSYIRAIRNEWQKASTNRRKAGVT